MKRKVKFILFMIAFCSIFLFVNHLYSPKWHFYQEDKDSMNVLFFGSSFSYCTFDPRIIDDDYIHSYNLASQQQPIQLTYYVIKEALKYQTPEVIVLEPWMLTMDYQNPSVSLMASTLDKMNLNMNKIAAINSSAYGNDILEIMFPILRLHSDPKAISSNQEIAHKDPLRGFQIFTDINSVERPDQSILNNIDKLDINPDNIEYLNKIINLSKENNIQLLIVKAPMPISEGKHSMLNTVKEIAENNDVPYIDFMNLYDEINFDFTTDTIDGQHLNHLGSEKVSKHFKTILKEYIK